jgi:hypothetical protein
MLKFVFHLALQTNSPCGKLAKAWWLDLQSDTSYQPSKMRSAFGNADLSNSQVGEFLPTLIQPK